MTVKRATKPIKVMVNIKRVRLAEVRPAQAQSLRRFWANLIMQVKDEFNNEQNPNLNDFFGAAHRRQTSHPIRRGLPGSLLKARYPGVLYRSGKTAGQARALREGKRLGRPAGSKDKKSRRTTGYHLRYANVELREKYGK